MLRSSLAKVRSCSILRGLKALGLPNSRPRARAACVPAGTYELLLSLPDPLSALGNRPEYAIQLANTDLWDPTTGFNDLQRIVTVTVPPRPVGAAVPNSLAHRGQC